MHKATGLMILIVVVGCNGNGKGAGPEPVATTTVTVSTPAPTPKPQEVTPFERISAATGFAQALGVAKPLMSDTRNDDSKGAVLLAAWSAEHLRWADIGVATDETSFALAQKDSDEARGKRLCVTGPIIQIAVTKTASGKINEGLMHSYSGNIFRFLATGSSGDLVQDSQARVCGVVTGKYDYSNSAGGVGHAIEVVGMFDLPQNKR